LLGDAVDAVGAVTEVEKRAVLGRGTNARRRVILPRSAVEEVTNKKKEKEKKRKATLRVGRCRCLCLVSSRKQTRKKKFKKQSPGFMCCTKCEILLFGRRDA
jgi:transcription antitermination factor NusG